MKIERGLVSECLSGVLEETISVERGGKFRRRWSAADVWFVYL